MTSQQSASSELPREGMLARIRNRLAIIGPVQPGGDHEQLHWVRVEYLDHDGPPDDQLLWECEPDAYVWPATRLPEVQNSQPMPARDFDALIHATRWGAITPFLDPAPADGNTPVLTAPLFGAVQVEDFQLIPLLEALRMPRVALLLADDVGLGKTIEAGLILNELLLRRRIRRILIICPASLRFQWQNEMKEKFSLHFDVVDREETLNLQKRLGPDANPWKAYPRIIASYHYLKQPDILARFQATWRRDPSGAPSAELPWDLLIVDEAHNLTPSHFGKDSDLAQMLRAISPQFEHRLFLSATPHNGYTRSFTGLLQQLDPVRFRQSSTVDEARVQEVVIRRLKSEIREADERAGRPARFAQRSLAPVPLYFGLEEENLSGRFSEFRTALFRAIASAEERDRAAGRFAVEVLNKRLLSCPYTFADSWIRFKQGFEIEEEVSASEVGAAQRSAEEDTPDDREREDRARHAAKIVGAWLRSWSDVLATEIAAVDQALDALGLTALGTFPTVDERVNRLVKLIGRDLREGKAWRNDERLIVFTEYKTTLDYLKKRLEDEFKDNGSAIRVLFGDPRERGNRSSIIQAFNDPDDPVRILIATDVASEGINLQETARLLLHYDIPWNPARLEQRNGRLDRHGQARDVIVHHFASDNDADVNFCARIAKKIEEIREDLGSVEEVLDAAIIRRFRRQEDTDRILADLEAGIDSARGRAAVPRDRNRVEGTEELARYDALRAALDLSPETLRSTLEVALGVNALEGPDGRGRFQIPVNPRWRDLIDESLRTENRGARRGVVFDPRLFVVKVRNRPVFRPMKDTALLHLGHPLFRQALSTFARRRYSAGHANEPRLSRWIIRRGSLPGGADAFVLLTVEELAANELRQPFHHWVRTLHIPVQGDELGAPLANFEQLGRTSPAAPGDAERAQDLFLDISKALGETVRQHARACQAEASRRLSIAHDNAVKTEKERFRFRKGEIKKALTDRSLASLQKQIAALDQAAQQLHLYAEETAFMRQNQRDMEDELERRTHHDRQLLELLEREEQRLLDKILPKRFALRGDVQVIPVAVEIRFAEGAR